MQTPSSRLLSLSAWLSSPLRWVRTTIAIAFVLVGGLCMTEVGLRVHRLRSTAPSLTSVAATDELTVVPSAVVFQSLPPMIVAQSHNPDTERAVLVEINSFGVRSAEPEVPKPPDVFRILCLGDETTLAADLPSSETFCLLLQELLTSYTGVRVEVINAGVPGYCPLLSLLQARHSLVGLDPDVVILNFDFSDVADDYQYRRFTVARSQSDPIACAHPQFGHVNATLVERIEDEFLLVQQLRQRFGRPAIDHVLAAPHRDIDSPLGSYAWMEGGDRDWSMYVGQTLTPIVGLQRLAAGQRSLFLVAIAPKPWQVSRLASRGDGVREAIGVHPDALSTDDLPFEMLEQFATEHRLNLINATSDFRDVDQSERLFHHNSITLSAEGHQVYAFVLAHYLIRQTTLFGPPPGSPSGPPSTATAGPSSPIGGYLPR